ncbi:hypothetical protein NDU88_006834 [Pleurodeles waltl]|uniref:Uncharacterized protein n=1 Tax=Pleurodeles waltl TaxID=8319 RepID=A0AAV7VQR4_PLEWA|nr:hypothetical protein NDU88_006834 [Pleurodeles waltl]
MRGAPRAIDVRLCPPENHQFGLRYEQARCESEESLREQDGGCQALRAKKETGRQAMPEEAARHGGDIIRGGEEAWRQEGIESATIRHSRP